MTIESDVREASKRFYAALNAMIEGHNGPMVEAWLHDDSVSTMHPIGGREIGWEQVRASFEGVGNIASSGQVELADQKLQVSNDMAYETGIERGHATLAGEEVTIEQRVTNIYRRAGGAWKIVHHHADPSSAMLDLLARLQQKS